ncbi:MAG: sulfotransferase family 2 domain-containing protein [Pseudomonadota bacterium]
MNFKTTREIAIFLKYYGDHAKSHRAKALMFVSDKYQFVFFEVQRTGSNSVTKALRQIDPESPTVAARALKPATDYHAFRIPDHAQHYAIIATHRNPYARLWSHWKHRNRHGNPKIFKETPWVKYIHWALDKNNVPEIQNATPEIAIMEMPRTDKVTHWLSFDNLADDWQAVCKDLNLGDHPLEVVNQSNKMGTLKNAYNSDLAELVYQRFKVDFDAFNYAKDSWMSD